ncbi:hypothetical protein [Streptomyces canus]|uniref:hypothetical protein n=1 Tax=Streptomyces canus TaxID=58343 RepID=UPI0033B8F826
MDHPSQPSVRHFDHCPWLFADEATEEQRAAQREVQRAVGGDTGIGERCYVAESAAVFPDRLRLGDDSYIAAHAYVTGELTTGSDCTLNPFTTVRGNVVLGDGVRIAGRTSGPRPTDGTSASRPSRRNMAPWPTSTACRGPGRPVQCPGVCRPTGPRSPADPTAPRSRPIRQGAGIPGTPAQPVGPQPRAHRSDRPNSPAARPTQPAPDRGRGRGRHR